MRSLRIAAGLVMVASVAEAAPLATANEDVDGDGAPEAIELGADGVVTIGGKVHASIKVAPDATRGRVSVGRYKGRAEIVIEVARGAKREAIVLEPTGTGWREASRVSLGGVGLDEDYGVEVEATPEGVFRYQTRADVHRCDGKPALLFAEKLDGGQWKRVARPPTNVAATLPVLTAQRDPATAAPPQLYQARAASVQPGATDAGGLGIPRELDDGKLDTYWKEEFVGSGGEGQYFTFEPRVAGARARQLRIVPGNATSAATIKSFNRPRRLAIVAASGAWRTELPDASGEPLGTAYTIDLPQPIAGCVTVVLEEVYRADSGQTAIAELEMFADGERGGGGDAMLAHVIAEGREGASSAAAQLARRGAAGVAAIDAELGKTSEAGARRRLVAALVTIGDPAGGPSLARAAIEGWVHAAALIDVIDALGRIGMQQELHDLAGRGGIDLDARIAAATALSPAGSGLALLIDLAGTGPREVRKAVIDRLSAAPIAALSQAALSQAAPAAAGDLWRAITRHARIVTDDRAPAAALMLGALGSATDYERRYRLVDGVASLGDAAAMQTLEAVLRALPPGSETAAVRQVALRAIASAPRPEAIALVLAFARDPDPGVRLAVLATLASTETDVESPWHTPDGPDGIDRVIATALSADGWPEVRRRAATALGTRCQRIGPARALGDAVAKDRHLDVRTDALTALVQCHAIGIADLLAHTWDDRNAPIELRTHAVNLAVALGDPKLGATLVDKFGRWRGSALESGEALALAQSAAAAIGLLRAPGAAPILLDALDDSAFPEIVSAAALALGALGPACPPAAKAKLTLLSRSDDQAAVAAKRAAAQCGK